MQRNNTHHYRLSVRMLLFTCPQLLQVELRSNQRGQERLREETIVTYIKLFALEYVAIRPTGLSRSAGYGCV
jgi:hypothetical protein